MSDEEHLHTPETAPASSTADEGTGSGPGSAPRPVGVIKGDVGLDTAQVFICAFLIVIVGFLVLAGALRVPLQGEDMALIAESGALHRVTTFPQALDAQPDAPLALLGLALNWRMFGGVLGLHLVNLLLHLGNGVLLYLICRKLMRTPVREPMGMAVGMIFLLHPLATEGVCYITARPAVQGTFFGLLGLFLFLRALESPPRIGHLAAALFCFALAFGSSALLLVLPLIFLGADLALSGFPGLRMRAGFHLASLGGMVALGAARAATGSHAWGPFPEGFGATLAAQSVYADVPGLHYPLIKLIAPMRHVSVGYPDAAAFGMSVWGLAILAAVAGLAVWSLYRARPIGTALWWILVTALAAPCLIPLDTLLAERNFYFLLAGVTLVAGLLLDAFRSSPASYAAGGLMAALVLACGVGGYARTEAWGNPPDLWGAAGQGPGGELALLQRARYLSRVVNVLPDEAARNEALASAKAAWMDVRDMAEGAVLTEALEGLGIAHHQLGENEQALPLLEEALRRNPFLQEASVRIALIHASPSQSADPTESRRRAIDYFQHAQRLGPLPPEALVPFAVSLAARGDVEVALPILQSVMAEVPADSPQMTIVKQLQAMAGRLAQKDQEAATLYQEQADSAAARAALAQTYLERNRLMPALYLLERAVETHPQDTQPWELLGLTKALMGDADGFIAERGSAQIADEKAWRGLATQCGRGLQWNSARAYLSHAADSGRLGTLAEVALAQVATELGQAEQAQAFLDAAAEAHPDHPAPWLARCDIAIAAGAMDDANRFLREAERRGASEEELAQRRAAGASETAQPALPERTVIR